MQNQVRQSTALPSRGGCYFSPAPWPTPNFKQEQFQGTHITGGSLGITHLLLISIFRGQDTLELAHVSLYNLPPSSTNPTTINQSETFLSLTEWTDFPTGKLEKLKQWADGVANLGNKGPKLMEITYLRFPSKATPLHLFSPRSHMAGSGNVETPGQTGLCVNLSKKGRAEILCSASCLPTPPVPASLCIAPACAVES